MNSFKVNLAAAIHAGQLATNHAVLFQASSVTLMGLTFPVVDADGVAGYQAGADYVLQLATPSASLVIGDFFQQAGERYFLAGDVTFLSCRLRNYT